MTAASLAAMLVLATAPSAVDAPRHASLAVETDIDGETGEIVRQRIVERGDVALRAASVLPARDEGDATITVVVHEDREASSYAFELRTTRAGTLDGSPVQGACRLCTEGELVEAIERELDVVIADLEPAAAPAPVVPRDPPVRAPVDAPRRHRLGQQGIAGVSLLVAGGVAIATGIGLAAAPPRDDADDPRYDVTTRPAGWAVLGAGAAVATVGAVLVGLDRHRAKRPRLAVGRHGGSLLVGVHGRF